MLSALLLPLMIATQTPDAGVAAPPPAAPVDPEKDALARAEHALFDEQDDAASYHKALAAYDEAGKIAPLSAVSYCRRAEAWLRLGDLGSEKSVKQGFYKKGQEDAERGLQVDKQNAGCHFWRAANLGRWGEQKGVLNALFLLDDVKGGFKKAVELDPNNLEAKIALAKVDELVPGFAGGSKERAENALRELIKKHPTYGSAKINLAELLMNDDREEEAKKLAQQVLDEKKPLRAGEHRKFDVKKAKKILAQ